MSKSLTVGVAGIGRMGGGIARSLRRADFQVNFLRHRSAANAATLLAAGCTELESVRQLAMASDLLLLCLPSSAEVSSVLSEIAPDARPGHGIILDSSTSHPGETRKWARRLSAEGTRLYDSPVTRTPEAAEQGTLNTITSCTDEDWPVVEPVIRAFSENIFRTAGIGSAHEVKLVNNVMSIGQVCLSVDALTLTRSAGADPDQVHEVVNAGAARSAAMSALVQHLATGEEYLNFTIAMALKDIQYARSVLPGVSARLTMLEAVEKMLSDAVERGLGDETLSRLLS